MVRAELPEHVFDHGHINGFNRLGVRVERVNVRVDKFNNQLHEFCIHGLLSCGFGTREGRAHSAPRKHERESGRVCSTTGMADAAPRRSTTGGRGTSWQPSTNHSENKSL